MNDVAGMIERSGVRVDGGHGLRIVFMFPFFTGIFGGSDERNDTFLMTSLLIDSVDDDDRDGDGDRV